MIFVQPQQEVQDDLAALLSRNLRLDPIQDPPPPEEPRIVYISQHYTHSTHVPQQQQQQQEGQMQIQASQRPSSVPPQPEYGSAENVLREHGVDPSALSTSQMQLFKSAEEPQQRRLMELWRICPPTNSTDNPTLTWTNTTVEQEEILAKMRYSHQQTDQEQHKQERVVETTMSLDGTPLTPIQAGDGRWVQTMNYQHYMEPYMASGYEELARREYEESVHRAYQEEKIQRPKDIYTPYAAAVDPVYQMTNNGLDWQRAQQQQQQMEDQYGRMMQYRNGDHDEEML